MIDHAHLGASNREVGSGWAYLAAFVSMLAAALLAVALAPKQLEGDTGAVDLNALVPEEIGPWRAVRSALLQVDLTPRQDGREDPERSTDNPYDETVMRTYARADGATVMLALAYSRTQRQDVKIHRPELCYAAQGFSVRHDSPVPLVFADGHAVTATRLVARRDLRIEPVTYWIRIGDEITTGAWQSRFAILRAGVRGRIPDGILVRVSSAYAPGNAAVGRAYEEQQAFLQALVDALDRRGKSILLAEAGHRSARP